MPQTERSGPHHRGRPGTTFTEAQGNPIPASVPTAVAMLVPATGRRQFDVAVVTRCPWCLAGHVHRGNHLDGAVRESGCRPAREYQLAVTS